MDKVGVFYCNLNDAISIDYWTVGANRRHDYGYIHKSITTFTVFGGGSGYGDVDGVFFCNLNTDVSGYSWGIGAYPFWVWAKPFFNVPRNI